MITERERGEAIALSDAYECLTVIMGFFSAIMIVGGSLAAPARWQRVGHGIRAGGSAGRPGRIRAVTGVTLLLTEPC